MFRTYPLAIAFLYFSIKMSAQKIVLQFDATQLSTPSVSKAALRYNKDFAYSFTLDDCSSDHFTVAKPLFQGGVVPGSGYTSPGLFFTDGCGNDLPFKAGIAWNSTNSSGYGSNANDGNYMSWAQLQEVYNLGWDVLNHSFAHRAWNDITGSYTYANQITQNSDNVRSHMGIEMPFFVVPSGDYNYQDVALQVGCKAVFDQNFPQSSVSYTGIQIDDNANMTNLKAYREEITTQIENPIKLTNIANLSTGGSHFWYNEFGHHIDNFNTASPFNFYKFKDYMLNIANTYGKNGSDRVWFAPLQEVYEYVVSRQNVEFTTHLTNDNKLEITLNLEAVPTWMRRKTLTLIINSTANFSDVTLPKGFTATWHGSGTTKLLNIDFTNFTPTIPVELTTFSVNAKGSTALLNWETASEERFQGFEIEKSLEGNDYLPIGFVKAEGLASEYAFEDDNFEKTSYYRLKMLDNDGLFDYSKIVSLLVPSKYTVKITPSVSDDLVVVETDFDDKIPATIAIFNQSGKLLIEKTATQTNTISLESLPQGLYFVRINHGLDFWVKKVMKF